MVMLKKMAPLLMVVLIFSVSIPVYPAYAAGFGDFRLDEEGVGSGGYTASNAPEDVANSFWDIYFKWIDPIRQAGTAVVLLMLMIITLMALIGGGVDHLTLIKKYLIVSAIALFLIWNALPLTLWLRDLFLK